MAKSRYKHFKDISKRHFNHLVKKEIEHHLRPSTFRSNDYQCAINVLISSSENVNQCDSEIPGGDLHYSSVEDSDENGSDSSENFVSMVNDNMHDNFSNTEVKNSSVINCSQNFISNLANWAVTYQVKSNAINALLEIQRNEPGYESQPYTVEYSSFNRNP